jgi:hypothetical protein
VEDGQLTAVAVSPIAAADGQPPAADAPHFEVDETPPGAAAMVVAVGIPAAVDIPAAADISMAGISMVGIPVAAGITMEGTSVAGITAATYMHPRLTTNRPRFTPIPNPLS